LLRAKQSGFQFSILDIGYVTAMVAVLFALPVNALQACIGCASVVLMIAPGLFFFTLFSAPTRANRVATTERTFIRILVKSLYYSAAVLIVGIISISSKI
jgi:hypothetical protein